MNQAIFSPLSRRQLIGAGGALIVSLATPGRSQAATDTGAKAKPPLQPDELASWIAVAQDGSVTAYFGKMDPGQGVDVAIAQIVADELDVPFARVSVVMGDTKWTVNQGGASGSTGIQRGGITLRYAAAEARRVLLAMAAERLGAEPETLSVVDGVVSVAADPARKISYGELIGGRYFDVTLQWNGLTGNFLVAKGKAVPKRPDQYRIVGQSVPRADIGQKVFGRLDFVTEVKLPGMLHGRMLRPPVAGAVPVAVDESSVSDLPGARVVWRKGFLGVVTDREWDAIRAARVLRVTWSQAAPPFPDAEQLYDHIRNAPVLTRKVELQSGAVDAAMAGAARIVEAEYEWPFQSHASMGPACSVADVRADGATVWTGSQKPHFTREGVAGITGLPVESVRAIWVRGPGCYGRNDAGDAAMDAALLSQAVGRPVRVQWMRDEGHGWDPKGPASIHHGRAALDAKGNVLAYVYESKGFSRVDIDTTEADPRQSLAGQLMGLPLAPHQGFGVPGEAYTFVSRLLAWETIAPLLDRASPLRSAHLRDPVGPQTNFGSETFIDELAAAVGADPVQFRLGKLDDPRGKAVIRAAAERAGWQARPAGSRGTGATLTGRGIAYAQRAATYVAVIAEVEIDRASGRVWPRRFVVAHDCGLIINPEGLRRCIEGNIVQGASRAIWEEVGFDRGNVTSRDWISYPILDVVDAPDAIDIVLINRPEVAAGGAGEASTRPVAAAIGNAIFDATGARLRRAPFRPDRLKALLL
jgi:nicotinate dehydrogenase subunit B